MRIDPIAPAAAAADRPTMVVFVGPTLPRDEAAAFGAAVLPPVSQGDIYRVGRRRPWAIGIIDGYFERVPAVWHKEILWALTQGIHVFGSASMGALRAAELATFGMEGVGEIFAAFQSGALEDDDEVAVIHGPPESGFAPLSEAMVNIRATLTAAATAGVIAEATRASLVRLAKALHYPERSYPALLARATAAGMPAPEIAALRRWLLANRIDRKRDDALAMLGVMRERADTAPQPKRTSFWLERTAYAERAQWLAEVAERQTDGGFGGLSFDRLLDELRLDGRAQALAWDGALLRELALAEASRQGLVVDADEIEATTQAFRQAFGLNRPARLADWLAANDRSPEEFAALMRDEALLERLRRALRDDAAASLPDHLRVTGVYAHLRERAAAKQRALEAQGCESPSPADAGVTPATLLLWHLANKRRVPNADVGWRAIDEFAGGPEFVRALLREYVYQQATGHNEAE
ncbi:MAG TPA: TfuA-like protein [Thermomicrobiales bacterium]|jgi:hypothetical protein|nr:TfuA-like protein [Thermomicrobiales bacterium]